MGLRKGQVQGRCEVKGLTFLYDLISLACGFRGKAGGWRVILFNEHFSMVGGHERA